MMETRTRAQLVAFPRNEARSFVPELINLESHVFPFTLAVK